MRRLHPPLRLDASFGDTMFALGAALASRAPVATARIGDALVCSSVRSALDLTLCATGFTAGDEVLISAVTHPDMVRIIESHGLRAVPVDIDPHTLAPHPVAASPRARAVLVAHLFGARVDLDEAVALAREHDLLLIEDCAQSLAGPDDCGDKRADVSLFSFGFLKTATALGGALVYVRDAELARRMVAVHDTWPIQSRWAYAARALRGTAALLASGPRAYALVARLVGDPTRLVRSGGGALRRQRPCGGLVATLRRRLRRFPYERLRRRAEAGDELAAALPPTLFHPGRAAAVPATHWLFPVGTDDPEGLVHRLRGAGFDASQGSSQIEAIGPSPGAQRLMAGLVFVPAYPELPASERRRLAEVLARSRG